MRLMWKSQDCSSFKVHLRLLCMPPMHEHEEVDPVLSGGRTNQLECYMLNSALALWMGKRGH